MIRRTPTGIVPALALAPAPALVFRLVLALVPALVTAPALADAPPADAAPSRKAGALAPGDAPPAAVMDLALGAADGRSVTLRGQKGEKGTLVIFTCSHCPFVKAWQDRMVAAAHAAQAKGVGVVAINPNDASKVPGDAMAAMKALAESKGYRFPYARDPDGVVGRAFGATRTPEIFLLDASDRVVYHGAIDDSADRPAAVKQRWLMDAIDALVSGKDVPVKQTKALGCSIKYAQRG